MSIILVAALLALPAWAQTGGDKFGYDSGKVMLAQELSQPPAEPAPDTAQPLNPEGRLVPGKALLLSAILPGAGQLYAKSPLMGALFLALEAGAWTGVAIYHGQGMDKEDEYKAFADANWAYDDGVYTSGVFADYWDYEYYCATVFGVDGETGNADTFDGSPEQWDELSWEDKGIYLPSSGFTHELTPDDKDQQYYEMIGKYDQFGAGWPAEDDEVSGYRTGNPLTETWEWGTYNTTRDKYLTMRKESNDALDMSKNFTMAVLGNHLLSALHAGFSVSMHNRKMAREQTVIEGSLQLEPRRINNENVTMAGLQIRF
ncbi:MAG: hypothetical protein C4524_13305 [Candidatus Zixiibacteriota bacterium]|nr:MAG: hypothetical protein C4524_13305 [candidate division Zixibacteria bacterium]